MMICVVSVLFVLLLQCWTSESLRKVQVPSLHQQARVNMGQQDSFIQQINQMLRRSEEDKEESRMLRRTVFTHSDWRRHRSSNRYFTELVKMPRSMVLRGLAKQALGVSLSASIVVVYNMLVELKIFSWPMPLLTVPTLPFSLTSSSLGLLLVFRTNTAYARWREARNYWSIVSSNSFDIMRQSTAWMDDKKQIATVFRYLVAFSKCLKWHLGDRSSTKRLQEDLIGIMSTSEIQAILGSRVKPQFVLLKLTRLIAMQNLIPTYQSHLDRSLIELSKATENCDNIYTTPIPLVYTRLTARFLILWLMTFPMSLYKEFSMTQKWVIPLVIFLNSIFLFGIEDVGVQIEEPFSILPLANICHNIQSSAQDILLDSNISWFHGEAVPEEDTADEDFTNTSISTTDDNSANDTTNDYSTSEEYTISQTVET